MLCRYGFWTKWRYAAFLLTSQENSGSLCMVLCGVNRLFDHASSVTLESSGIRPLPHGLACRFGVREHAMGAIVNGVALHKSGLIPYCATFYIFTDYMRSAMRMSALSEVCKPRCVLISL